MFHSLNAVLELHLIIKIFLTGENYSQESWWIRGTFSPNLFIPSKSSMVVISILSENMASPYLHLLQICLTPFSCMLFPITTHLYIYCESMAGTARGTGDAHPSRAPDLTSRCLGVHVWLYKILLLVHWTIEIPLLLGTFYPCIFTTSDYVNLEIRLFFWLWKIASYS